MITKEITICGKQVKVAYCYATEIAYNEYTGEELPIFIQQASAELVAKKMPKIKNVIFAVIAAMTPCYKDAEQAPIKDTELMNDATPKEVGLALGTIINMYGEFYNIPLSEPKDKEPKKNGRRKNA